MRILALDSSSPVASVAFVECCGPGTKPFVAYRRDTPHRRSDSSALFEGLQSSISCCGMPDAVAVGLGPGSYNGLRAGIAAARAFATARDIPLLALPSPLALPGPADGFWAVGDARGGHYWIACVTDGTFLELPALMTPAAAAEHLHQRPGLSILSATPLEGLEGVVEATPDAALLAILAEKNEPYLTAPEPLYLKPPHITSPRESPRTLTSAP